MDELVRRRPAFVTDSLLRLAPFGIPAILAFALVPLPPDGDNFVGLLAAAGLTAVLALAILVLPWSRMPGWTWAVPPIAYLVVVALLRDSEGGNESIYPILVLLPVVWLALYGTSVQLGAALVGVLVTFAAPILLFGSPEYPPGEWGRVLLWAIVGPFIGYTIQRLVAGHRDGERDRATMAAVARELATSDDARLAVCRAAVEVSGADLASLWEPETSERLRLVVQLGDALPDDAVVHLGREPSGIGVAFTSRRRFFVPDASTNPAVSPSLVRRTGSATVLFEPVMRGDEPLGVLVLVWRTRQPRLSDRVATMISLLAGDAAVAVGRGDLLRKLREVARTDALTGLPNRRAWEEELPRELARATRSSSALCVAMIDLDHFKTFNDEHGHQHGDRVLKASASAWGSALRTSDRLARYGGDEFAAIFPDCALERAEALVERMRQATPDLHTCSVGIAAWDGDESPAALVGRADQALYEAKSLGRNRTAVDSPNA